MGRPNLDAALRRNKQISTFMTDDEVAMLDQLATNAEKTRAAYLRDIVLNQLTFLGAESKKPLAVQDKVD